MLRSVLLLSALVFLGCSSAPSESEEATSAGSVVMKPASDQELIPFVSRAVLQTKIDAFRARNGADFEALRPEAWKTMIPGVVSMNRPNVTDAGNVIPTAAQQAQALAFVRANLDTFGIESDIELTVRPLVAVAEVVSAHRPFAGLAADWRVTNTVTVDIIFAADGSIKRVFQHQRFPQPTLSTKPIHAATDKVIADRLLGLPLIYGSKDFSVIGPKDLESTEIVTHVETREDGMFLTLAHRIGIYRDDTASFCPPWPDVAWELVVDTRDGQILDGSTKAECYGW